MIKKIIISALFLVSFASLAQEGTSSPYSFYGIGDVRFKGNLENRSMAGLGVELDSIHMNIQNPASYSALKLTTYAVGGTYASTKLKTDSESASAKLSTFDYLAVAFPVGKLGVAFGLLPYSSVGYKIQSISNDPAVTSKLFNGSGGLNKVFLGLGYMIKPGFSVGADLHYNFGKIETTSVEFIPDVPVGTQEKNKSELSGVNFNLGAMYETKIKDKLNFYGSVSYGIATNLKSNNERQIATGYYTLGSRFTNLDTLAVEKTKVDLKLPSRVTFGAGIGEKRKWLIGAQMTFQGKGVLDNENGAPSNNVGYGTHSEYSLGGYYIPNYNSFSSYLQRIVYRAGLRYEKTGLIVNSEGINDIGFTLGAGFPITGTFSNINLGLEMGKKGTTSSNLVQENYFNVSVAFSLNDKWFVRRGIN